MPTFVGMTEIGLETPNVIAASAATTKMEKFQLSLARADFTDETNVDRAGGHPRQRQFKSVNF
ncbi:MAG: hypothetical protein ABW006_02725 [Hyphomicrobium sp.]